VCLLDIIKKRHQVYNNSIHLDNTIKWLCQAQDSTCDGGVSEGYHLYHGWLPSYPETTGYIIETFFDYYKRTHDDTIKNRAVRMADWLMTIQNDDGSLPDSYFRKKMVFDTGQVIFGLVRTYEETGREKYKDAAAKAGEWIIGVQEEDGTWRRHSLFEIPHAYYTRVAWSLLLLYHLTKNSKYIDSCVKNIEWAISQQRENGWFNNASFSLTNHHNPYTHTIAYTIRGILETGMFLKDEGFISTAIKAVDNLIKNIPENGFVHGTYNEHWKGDSSFSCLTGDAQLAIILFKVYTITKNDRYFNRATKINTYLKLKQELRVRNTNIHGAIAGSYPVWGKYLHFIYPNWACKFFADSLMLEEKIISTI